MSATATTQPKVLDLVALATTAATARGGELIRIDSVEYSRSEDFSYGIDQHGTDANVSFLYYDSEGMEAYGELTVQF